MVQETVVLSGGITADEELIKKDAYLIIVAGEQKNELSVAPYSRLNANKANNLLNTALRKNVANVAMAGVTSPIVQNMASKHFSTATLGRINSSLYDIMSDGAITNQEVAEDFIGSCTNHIDNCATDLGFPTPSSLYSAIAPNGYSGVISKDVTKLAPEKIKNFFKSFKKHADEENKELDDKQQEQNLNVIIVKLKLVKEDTESLNIDIPTRRTENNFNIATAVNNQNLERSFSAIIVHTDSHAQNMINIKQQLTAIRDMRDYINVYVCDNDIQELEVIEDCLMSSLGFNVKDKNTLECSIGFVKVPKWTVRLDASLDKRLTTQASGASGNKVKSRQSTPNSNVKNKGTAVQDVKNFELGNDSGVARVQTAIDNYEFYKTKDPDLAKQQLKTISNALNANKANKGYSFTPDSVKKTIDAGGKVIRVGK